MELVERILDIILASVFFYSFYTKSKHFTQFKIETFSYNVLPVYLVSSASLFVLLVEFIIFLAFSISYPSRIKAFILLFLMMIFTVLIWIKRKRLGSTSCGCFGKADVLNNHPFIRNISLMGLSVLECFLPFYHSTFIQSLFTSIGIISLVLFFDIAQMVGSKKGLIKWERLKL